MFTPEYVVVVEVSKEVNPQGVIGNLGDKCFVQIFVGVERNLLTQEGLVSLLGRGAHGDRTSLLLLQWGRRCGQERDCYETLCSDPVHRWSTFRAADKPSRR